MITFFLSPSLQHIHSRSALECAYRTHLIAGVGFFQHLLLYIQSHYQLELQDCIDWTHVTDPLIGKTCFPFSCYWVSIRMKRQVLLTRLIVFFW